MADSKVSFQLQTQFFINSNFDYIPWISLIHKVLCKSERHKSYCGSATAFNYKKLSLTEQTRWILVVCIIDLNLNKHDGYSWFVS